MLLGWRQHDDLLVRGNQLTTGLRNNDRADVITDTDLTQFCRPRDAGLVFERLVRLFAAVAPVLLAVTALVEAWRALH